MEMYPKNSSASAFAYNDFNCSRKIFTGLYMNFRLANTGIFRSNSFYTDDVIGRPKVPGDPYFIDLAYIYYFPVFG